jgi:tetratricopeptide (TPR) repeat protein
MKRLIYSVLATAAATIALGGVASAQSPAEHMELGDQAAEAMNPTEAITHYDAILSVDSMHYEALWKFSMNAVDLGEFEPDEKKREELYRRAENASRRAVEINDKDAETRFHLARALGMAALSVGIQERVRYAGEIREQALEALRLDPKHPGALHVLGVWHAEVMRISGIQRTLARAFLGAGFFAEASWDEAIRLMEEAVAVDPQRLTHHLDLARIYRDRKMVDKARASYQLVLDGKPTHVNDQHYKKQAAEELARIR